MVCTLANSYDIYGYINIYYYDKFKKSFEQEAILRNLSTRTRQAYWWHIQDYYNFHLKDPEQTGVEELRSYFQSMLSDGKHKPGSVKMGYFALKFLFTQIYHKEWAKEYLPTPKIAKTLPLVLSQQEVRTVIEAISNFKHRCILMFIYSTGTRVSECVNIKLTDIDSKRRQGIIRLLSACRTSALGSHYEKCEKCNYQGKAHNSCRNRHCTVCQQKEKLQWLDKRMQELLPVGYYHLVFTIPHEFNPICQQNKKVMYNILFKTASETILELAKDSKHMGANTGTISVLHTWGQNMKEHPHLHCIMPAGGLAFDNNHWVHTDKKNDFFVHHKVLSNTFRGKFLALLQKAYEKGELSLSGKSRVLTNNKRFSDFTWKLKQRRWVVNIQKPFGSPKKVLEYLSRYIFRIAITDRRIIEVKDGKVLFSWKDYRTGTFKKMSLEIDEFIRRFLLHVLPQGFFKVRYHGIFSNRYRKKNIATAKKLLKQQQDSQKEEAFEDGRPFFEKQNTVWEEIHKLIHEFKKPNCPKCKKGRLRFAGIVPRE